MTPVFGRWLAARRGAALWIGTQPGDGSGAIGVTRFHADRGRIGRVRTVDAAGGPSWLLPARTLLHVVFEEGPPVGGRVASFRRHGARLHRCGEVPSGGDFPCHLAIDETGRLLAAAHYNGGVSILPLDALGRVGPAAESVLPPPASPGSSRPHCVEFRSGSLWIADFAADCLWVAQSPGGHPDPMMIPLPPGTGPRMMAFHPHLPRLYIVGERDNSLTVLSVENDSAEVVARHTLLPASAPPGTAASHLLFHPTLPVLYAGVRGPDLIVSFRLTTSGDLGDRSEASAGGRHPRHFCTDPDGRWLLVANRDSNRVSVLGLDAEGRPGAPVSEAVIRAPSCVTFVNDS